VIYYISTSLLICALASLSTGVVASSVGSSRLGPLEVLLDDSGLLLDIVSLGVLDGKVEVVKDGVNETNNGNTDCLLASRQARWKGNVHRAQARPLTAMTRPHSE
jgi:hypothetical protein